MLWTPLSAKNT